MEDNYSTSHNLQTDNYYKNAQIFMDTTEVYPNSLLLNQISNKLEHSYFGLLLNLRIRSFIYVHQ